MRVWVVLFVCTSAVAYFTGSACRHDFDCFETETDGEDTPFCYVYQDFAPPSIVPASPPFTEGFFWPASNGTAGSAATGFNASSGAFATPAVPPVCSRPASPEVSRIDASVVAAQERAGSCVQCTEDWHCGPREFCVGLGAGKTRVARSASPFAFRSSNPNYRSKAEAERVGFYVGGCFGLTGPAEESVCPSVDLTFEEMAFTHPEYDESYKVGTCAPIGYPIGKECSPEVNIGNYDEGENSDLYCGIVSQAYEEECEDGLVFGEPSLFPARPARFVQWEGQCINRKCYQCRLGETKGNPLAPGRAEYTCKSTAINGAGGTWGTFVDGRDITNIGKDFASQGILAIAASSLCTFCIVAGFALKMCCCRGGKAKQPGGTYVEEGAEPAAPPANTAKKAKMSDPESTEETEEETVEETEETEEETAETEETEEETTADTSS